MKDFIESIKNGTVGKHYTEYHELLPMMTQAKRHRLGTIRYIIPKEYRSYYPLPTEPKTGKRDIPDYDNLVDMLIHKPVKPETTIEKHRKLKESELLMNSQYLKAIDMDF